MVKEVAHAWLRAALRDSRATTQTARSSGRRMRGPGDRTRRRVPKMGKARAIMCRGLEAHLA